MRNNQVKKIVNLSHAFLKSVVIRWQVTYLCNYQCDFCIQGLHSEHIKNSAVESSGKRQEIAESIVRFIEAKIPSRKVVELYLIGGEVTILKDFLEILRKFVSCDFKGHIIVYLTTNLSMGSDYFVNLINLFKGKRNRTFRINASFYRDFTSSEAFFNTVSQINRFSPPVDWRKRLSHIKAASLLGCHQLVSQNNYSLSIGIPIIDDDSWCSYHDIKSSYRQSGVRVNPILLRNYKTKLSIEVSESLKAGKAHGGMLSVFFSDGTRRRFATITQLGEYLEDTDGLFNPQGYDCDAGHYSFSISIDGEVRRCPALSTPSSFKIGHIGDKEFSLMSTPAVCQAGHCSCNYFTIIRQA